MLNPEYFDKIKQLNLPNIIDSFRKNELTVLRVIIGLILPLGIIMIISITLQCKEKDEINGKYKNSLKIG